LPRDLAARDALARQAGRILRQAGGVVRVRLPVKTFSHAVGTCRFGDDPERAVLDPWCRFFGLENLFVVDGSFMPTAGAVNPSLTIAANALRVGDHLAREAST
jgi:choline dehydrogenase-like flavoprotein